MREERLDGTGIDAHALFDAIPGRRKRLVFRAGDHDDWSDEAVDQSVAFIGEHTV